MMNLRNTSSRWRRLMALLFDLGLILFLTLLFGEDLGNWIGIGLMGQLALAIGLMKNTIVLILFGPLVFLLYYVPEIFLGVTPGKALFRLRVCPAPFWQGKSGSSYLARLLRYLWRGLPMLILVLAARENITGPLSAVPVSAQIANLFLFAGFLAAFFRRDGVAWHDWLSGTRVESSLPES